MGITDIIINKLVNILDNKIFVLVYGFVNKFLLYYYEILVINKNPIINSI